MPATRSGAPAARRDEPARAPGAGGVRAVGHARYAARAAGRALPRCAGHPALDVARNPCARLAFRAAGAASADGEDGMRAMRKAPGRRWFFAQALGWSSGDRTHHVVLAQPDVAGGALPALAVLGALLTSFSSVLPQKRKQRNAVRIERFHRPFLSSDRHPSHYLSDIS